MVVNVGVDLHKTQFTVSVRDTKNQFAEYQTDEDGYKKFLGRVKAWQKKGALVRVGVESTGNTRFFKNQMEQAGIEVVVINTLKFKVVNESVKKTDRHDAATIAEFLEKDMLPEAQVVLGTERATAASYQGADHFGTDDRNGEESDSCPAYRVGHAGFQGFFAK